jgi:hypothetical protein
MNLSSPSQATRESTGSRLIPWFCLLAAIVWSVLLRVPLIANAPVHLDSDLAVDGLTLQEALDGQWRWHYPGTPYMGTPAVLLSWPQARVWGATPETLVSGGTVAHVILMLAAFALAWRVFGSGAAIGSLIPLAFASTGVLWLSGRITGGHVLVVAWSVWAWRLAYDWFAKPGTAGAITLGLWCGLGVYLDSMFVLTLGGVLVAGLMAAPRLVSGRLVQVVAFVVAFSLGTAPRAIGQRLEPYDAYNEQFTWTLDSHVLAQHSRILLLDCLPRLIVGHRLPGLEADPDPALLGTGGPVSRPGMNHKGVIWPAALLAVLGLALFAAALRALGAVVFGKTDPPARAVALGMLASAAAVVGGFLINRNIFNSDNYRYLVLLLVPWSLGCGRVLQAALGRAGKGGCAVIACVVAAAALYTYDAAAWYRRLGWIDASFQPLRARVEDPANAWLRERPEIQSVFGSYWDVYRLSFLSEGRLRGVPFPIFPNRFPEWSAGLPGGRPETLLARRSPEGQHFLNSALREGGKVLYRQGGVTIVHWPWARAEPQAR